MQQIPKRKLQSCLSLTLALALPQPSTAETLSPPKHLSTIAQASTVRIETPGSPGSGVLIRNSATRCVILTAHHVVAQLQDKEEGEIHFRMGGSRSFNSKSVERKGNSDLAAITLDTSCPASITAPMGSPNDVDLGDTIYISGFSANRSPEVNNNSYRLPRAEIISLSEQRDGYSLTYTNKTMPGMSGGGIFSMEGELIGIHGRGETLGTSGEKIASMGMSLRLLSESPTGNSNSHQNQKPSNIQYQPRNKACPGVVC